MVTLTCPKCRHAMPEDALDVGQCPTCGFPLDGPLAFGSPGPRRRAARLLAAAGAVGLLAGGGYAGYALLNRTHSGGETTAADRRPEPEPAAAVRPVAPFPHEPRRTRAADPEPEPPPPTRDGPRPVAVVVPVNPKIAPVRHFDQPDDTVRLPDLNTNDRVVLTGRVRVLRLGSVNGKGSVDASGLAAEEVLITGDLNGEAVVTVCAPSGTVALGGNVMGLSKLTIRAPGGRVLLERSGRFTGRSTATITARRLEALGPLTGDTKVNVTFTRGGSLKLVRAEEGAILTYRKTAAGDPAPTVETGEVRDGAKVLAQ
jgi:hypothetical protein